MEWCYELFYDKSEEVCNKLYKVVEDDFNGKPIKIEPEYGLLPNGTRMSVANGNSTNRKVVFSILSNQLLWYISWYGFHLWSDNMSIVDKSDFLKRLHIIDSHKAEIQNMTCKDLDSWDSEELAIIFAYATNFILFHEIGHIVKSHTLLDSKYNVKPKEELRQQEYEADEYSMKAVLVVAQNDETPELANLGVLCAQCLMFFEKKKNENYENSAHGDPMNRIEQKLQMIGEDTEKYRHIVRVIYNAATTFINEKFGQ